MTIIQVVAACLILSTAVMTLASTSIGRECYDKNSSFADAHKDNGKYLLYMLIMGVLCVLISFYLVYLGFHGPPPKVV